MKFIRENWFRLGLLAFICMAFWALFYGDNLNITQKLLLASLMALPLHQFEEYALPGGGPVVINRIFWGEKEQYRNYPGNWNSIMIVNLSAYVFYILAILFPEVIWIGMATMFFNLFQVLGHVLEMNIKGKTWYNPGMATSICLFLPISIAYIHRMAKFTSGADWAAAVIATIVIMIVSVILPVQLLKKKNSPYDIPQWQLDQFEKVYKKFHW